MRSRMRWNVVVPAVIVMMLTLSAAPGWVGSVQGDPQSDTRTLDGSGNNLGHPSWGQAGTKYRRVGAANYADGVSLMVSGPPARYISNRVFNDVGQNLFSENGISQWGWTWGQFVDHDIGLRDQGPGESAPISFDETDPLEDFQNDFPEMSFKRTPAAKGSGVTTPRQQINTLSSYIDGSGVYSVDSGRLEWLRVGPVDNDLSNNGAELLLTEDGYLPRRDARGDAASAPQMELVGPMILTPERAVVAGDVRANENIMLTALHTLFAREHNRIVAALPSYLSAEEQFQIARRIVGAEIQFITYREFLPTLGVKLAPYYGYNPWVNAGLSNEFAVVGYRAHSMIHGEFDATAPADTYTDDQLEAFRNQGITVGEENGQVTLEIPLNVAFGNPNLLEQVGIGPSLESLGAERQYKNDEQIDNALRSVLFQVPKPGIPDPSVCLLPVVDPDCFSGVIDLGAIDIQRGRDHGLPTYNNLRWAYGLLPKGSFTAITGEQTSRFPSDPELERPYIDDPDILDFVELRDEDGNVIPPDSEEAQEEAVVGVRRTTLASRLRAIYGDVNKVDAFVGMVSEPHVYGTEFGRLQLAIWKKQFQALRDGDRFFYGNDPVLFDIECAFGISFRHTLAEIVQLNTGVSLQANVFRSR